MCAFKAPCYDDYVNMGKHLPLFLEALSDAIMEGKINCDKSDLSAAEVYDDQISFNLDVLKSDGEDDELPSISDAISLIKSNTVSKAQEKTKVCETRKKRRR
jgi:hypothetical protein